MLSQMLCSLVILPQAFFGKIPSVGLILTNIRLCLLFQANPQVEVFETEFEV